MTSDREMIEDVRSAEGAMGGVELSQWEQEFMESCESRIEDVRGLTPTMRERLKKIWDRIE